MAQIPKGRLVTGPYKPICSGCAMYFSITVNRLVGPIRLKNSLHFKETGSKKKLSLHLPHEM